MIIKKILAITGVLAGILFSLWDSMVNYADTAPIDDEIGIEIISWPFFITKILLYMALGGTSGYLISFIAYKLQQGRKKN